jgi:Hypoxia induced protein conserved region
MAKSEAERPVILSSDDARAGVTGHHVRYVLGFGLAGSLIAFIAIVLYFGRDRLTETIASIFAVPGTLTERLLLYAIPLALAAVAAALLLGLWNMVWGRSASVSQKLMRWRVVLQFIALCLVMAALFFSVR